MSRSARNEVKEVEAVFGDCERIAAWMQLVRKVRREFPGLETEALLKEHRQTVLRFMEKRQALCVTDRETVSGVLLFSRSRNMICCLAVDPAYRKRGIASVLLRKALDELDRSREITVSTFRETDEKGIAPRALYKKFGFKEAALTEEFGYPNQVFVLSPSNADPGGKNPEPVFESERIRYVSVSERLVNDYLVMVNDYENVNRYLGGVPKAFTVEQEIEWVRKALASNALVFSMIEKESGEFIGNIEFMRPHDGEAELGIALTAEKQDRGYGTEAVSATVRYGFSALGLKRVFLRTNPDNARAIRVYQKCGFSEYARTDAHICMEILRKDPIL